jgi:hypothetical protein
MQIATFFDHKFIAKSTSGQRGAAIVQLYLDKLPSLRQARLFDYRFTKLGEHSKTSPT